MRPRPARPQGRRRECGVQPGRLAARLRQRGDGTVKLWDATAATRTVTLARGLPTTVNDMAFDPDGRRLAVAGDHTLHAPGHDHGGGGLHADRAFRQVFGVAYSPDGRRLASAGEDRTVRVWDATNGTEIFCLRGHTASVRAVAFSPDGQRLASISRRAAGGGRPRSRRGRDLGPEQWADSLDTARAEPSLPATPGSPT